MKTQTILFVAVAILGSILLASADQDAGCRTIAEQLNYPQEQIAAVKRFTLYGQPRHPKTCQDACEAVGKTIGFDYFGKQACCCGSPQTA